MTADTVAFFHESVAPEPGEKLQVMSPLEMCRYVDKLVVNVPIHGQGFFQQSGHVSVLVHPDVHEWSQEVVFVFQQVAEDGHLHQRASITPMTAANAAPCPTRRRTRAGKPSSTPWLR